MEKNIVALQQITSTKGIGMEEPVVLKKYANRRLYDTEKSIYVTLQQVADIVRRRAEAGHHGPGGRGPPRGGCVGRHGEGRVREKTGLSRHVSAAEPSLEARRGPGTR